MPAESRVQVRWRTLTIVLTVLLAMAIATAVLAVVTASSYANRLPRDIAAKVAALPRPTTTVTATVPAKPVPLADQVAVAWSVATGWPNSEKWGYISGYESVGDDLIVHTNAAEPTDLSEMCGKLFELNNDDVIGLDPQIDQVLATGVDGQVIWSCVTTSEVQ